MSEYERFLRGRIEHWEKVDKMYGEALDNSIGEAERLASMVMVGMCTGTINAYKDALDQFTGAPLGE